MSIVGKIHFQYSIYVDGIMDMVNLYVGICIVADVLMTIFDEDIFCPLLLSKQEKAFNFLPIEKSP